MTDKEIIEIDGINVLECEHYQYKSLKDCEMRYPESGDCEIGLLNYLFDGNLDMEKLCKDNPNCYYKQLQKEKFENLNNRQMVESAENLIYENSELIKNLEEKKQECEELKKQLMQKSEVDMFFNTPIEGWSNDPCGICPHKAENEELKKEIIDKNEKIKELRFSVSDLTNRLCSLNAEKSFRIVDLEQALEEIEKVINNILNSCLGRNTVSCRPAHNVCGDLINILDIIKKIKESE